MIPTESDHREDLRRLVGRWQGIETMMPSRWAPAGAAESIVETELALGGAFILQNYRQSRDGAKSFEARAVFGYDDDRRQAVMYLFDAMGYPPEPAYGVVEGDALVFTRNSPRGQGQHRFTFGEDGSYRLVVRFAPPDGSWGTVMEGAYTLVPFA